MSRLPGSQITWRGEQFIQRFRAACNTAATAGAAVAAREAATSFQRSAGPSKAGEYPRTDTGHLRRSITFVSPQVTGRRGVAAFGTNVKYGRTLEFGGTITAGKTAKNLTIPMNREAVLMRRRHKSLRSVPGLRLVKIGHKKYLAQGDKFLFVLKPSVFIAARPWAMRSALRAAPAIRKRIAQTLQAALASGLRGGAA